MDSDNMSEFDNVYKAIFSKLEALRSIHASTQLGKHLGSPGSNVSSRNCKFSSGMTVVADAVGSSHLNAVCPPESRVEPGDEGKGKLAVGFSGNIDESMRDHPIHLTNNIIGNTQGRNSETLGMVTTDIYKEKENSSGRVTNAGRSPQPIEMLKQQAREWACEEVIRVLQEHSGDMGNIETSFANSESKNSVSDIVRNLSKVMKEKVEKIEVEARKVVELKEALSAEKNIVQTMQNKRLFLQGLLHRALDTAENGIFMCNQCQFVVDKVKEPFNLTESFSKNIHCKFTGKEQRETCHNADNLESNKICTTTSRNTLLDRENKLKDGLDYPLIQSSSNLTSKLWTATLGETHQMVHGNICRITSSKLVNVDDRRLELQPDGDTITDSEPFMKRKWLDDSHVEEGGSGKTPKFSAQTVKAQCSNGSQEFNSIKTSEMCFAERFHYDNTDEHDLTCNHDRHEDEEHSIGQAGAFTLLLEEEFDDDLE